MRRGAMRVFKKRGDEDASRVYMKVYGANSAKENHLIGNIIVDVVFNSVHRWGELEIRFKVYNERNVATSSTHYAELSTIRKVYAFPWHNTTLRTTTLSTISIII